MKKLKVIFLVLILLVTLGVFCGCTENTVTDFKIENYQTDFDLFEDFSFGNQAVFKILVNEKWEDCSLDEIKIINGNYNRFRTGTYTIEVQHNKCDKIFTLKVNVNKIMPEFEMHLPVYAVYGQTLSEIQLNDRYVWADPTLSVGNVTNYEGRPFDVYFTKTEDYLPVAGKVNVIVRKQTAQFVPLESFQANYLQRLKDIPLPENYQWGQPNQYVGDCNPEGNLHNVIYNKGENYTLAIGQVTVYVSKIDPIVNPVYDRSVVLRYGDNLPELTLSAGNTTGNIVWQQGQTLQTGTKKYKWEYIPDNPNYNNATGEISLSVLKQIIQIPVSQSYDYTGQEITFTLLADAELCIVSGTSTATEKGTYYAIVAIKDKSNYEWFGGIDNDLQIKWTIN